MQEQELEYLRGELNQYLNLSSEHTHRLFERIMLVWGGTLALFGTKQACPTEKIAMLFIMATIFFISVVLLYFLSHRNFASIKNISKIAAYIAIFYEKRPNGRENERIFWELANFEIDKKNMEDSETKRPYNKFNNEYFWLSIIAIGIIVAILIGMNYFLSIINFNTFSICLKNKGGFGLWMFSGCLGYIVISAFLSVEIFKHIPLDSEEWRDIKKGHLKYFLDYAVSKTGHYTKNEAKKRFGKEFYKEIMGE